jgi:hypothetical protein
VEKSRRKSLKKKINNSILAFISLLKMGNSSVVSIKQEEEMDDNMHLSFWRLTFSIAQ